MTAITKPAYSRQLDKPEIIWEKLPPDFKLPDEPVESIAQPLLAAALTESLDLAGRISSEMLIASNMALVVKINRKTVVKAPDWFYVANVNPARNLIVRSYSPHIDGEIPAIAMEFLSEEDTSEYSMRPTPVYGKMYFYEQILQIPIYVIFDPEDGRLEIRTLNSVGKYEIQNLDSNGRFLIESLGLYLGVWRGTRLEQTFYWLRWWDISGNLLLWGTEKLAQKQELLNQKQELLEAEQQRADLAEQEVLRLRELLANK